MYARGRTCSVLATTLNLHENKKHIGGEKVNKQSQYTERLKLRMTAEDQQALQAKAAQANMTVSAYLRALINNKKIVVAPDLPKLAVQIIKIGVNVNQICNVAKDCGTVSHELIAEIEKQYTDIQNLTGDLIREVYYRKDRNRYKI